MAAPRRLDLPKGLEALDFSRIALGHDFLCGISKLGKTSMSCLGAVAHTHAHALQERRHRPPPRLRR